ncbi:hypothetical protein ACIQ34_05385 [Ureibacillus sp. NPDC094379]
MKKSWVVFLVLVLTSLVLSGCLFPENQKAENQVPDDLQLEVVQRAVEEFQADTGVLPIKTRDMETDIFIKYPIDFSKLIPKYMAKSPGNSYEQGGIFQYIIWDPEKNPTVKLVDLRSVEKIRELNIRFLATKYPTFKEQISDYVYTIDFEKIGYDEELTVPSPYSNNQLPLVATTEGDIYVDYSIDLNLFIKENKLTPKPGEDIRMFLVEKYPVVPAYSLPYTVDENNEPVYMFDPSNEK